MTCLPTDARESAPASSHALVNCGVGSCCKKGTYPCYIFPSVCVCSMGNVTSLSSGKRGGFPSCYCGSSWTHGYLYTLTPYHRGTWKSCPCLVTGCEHPACCSPGGSWTPERHFCCGIYPAA